MSYSKSVIAKANSMLEKRRSKAERIQLARHIEVTTKIPRISELEAMLSKTGLEVVKAIGMGKDAEEYIRNLSEHNLAVQAKIKELLTANGYL